MKKTFLLTLIGAVLTCYSFSSNAQRGVTKLGTNALANNTVRGIFNTGLGYNSLNANTTGQENTAIGGNTLASNIDGKENTATGYGSLYKNQSGSYNTGYGVFSLYQNILGSYNTAHGTYSLQANTKGQANTAIGYMTLYNNIEGYDNLASGFKALYENKIGSSNSATGSQSLYKNTAGEGNTANGTNSLYNNTIGLYNSAFGYGADVTKVNLINATAIGYNAKVNASNKVRIGNTSVTSIGGQVGWTTFSDGRFKTDIKENIQGLVFINSLRPITYKVNVKGLNEYYNKGSKPVADKEASMNKNETVNAEMAKGEEAASQMVHNGFIAQEVEEAAKKLNFEFGGVDKPESRDGLYGLRYENFIVPLVKAIQELSKQNEELTKTNENMQNQINELKAMKIGGLQSNVSSHPSTNLALTGAFLEQNVPNPFNKITTINYNLPDKFTNAQIVIYDISGIILKKVNISGSGKGTLNLDATLLSSAISGYSLIVEGVLIDTKKLVLIK